MNFIQSNITTGLFVVKLSNNYGIAGSDNNRGIYYTINGGQTWSQSNISTGYFSTLSISGLNGIAYRSYSQDQVYYTTNGGQTWLLSNTTIRLSPMYIDNLYCVSASGQNGLYYSVNGGQNWYPTNITVGTFTDVTLNGLNGIACSGNYILNNGLFYTRDGGQTWSKSNIQSGNYDSVYMSGTNAIASQNTGNPQNGRIAYSSNSGASWTIVSISPGSNTFSVNLLGLNGIAGSSSNSGLYYTTNRGESWTQSNITTGYYAINYGISPIGLLSEVGIAASVSGTGRGILQTNNNGLTWIPTNITNGDFNVSLSGQYIIAGSNNNSGIYFKPVTTINVQSSYNKTVIDDAFNLNAVSTNPAAISYTSSDDNIASVDQSGLVTIHANGTAIITVYQPSFEYYSSGTAYSTINVSPITTVINVSSQFVKTYGDIPFNLNASSNSPATITYTSSDANIATVDQTGLVTIVDVGTAVITISQQSYLNAYTPDTVYSTIIVNPITTVINVTSQFVKTYGDIQFTLNATSNSPDTITYTSSNPNIAAVDQTGLVTIFEIGTTTITLSQEPYIGYNSAIAYSTIIVDPITSIINVETQFVKTYGNIPFNLNATSNSPATITYTSSNPDIVSVDQTGLVIIANVGTATITLSQQSYLEYSSAISYSTIIINPIETVINVDSTFTKIDGDTPFNLNATSNSSAIITYTSSNPDIATVDQSGLVTIISVGTAIITISQPSYMVYSSAIAYSNINIKSTNTIIYVKRYYNKTMGNEPFNLNATSTSPVTITYTSSDTNIATVDQTGLVTIVAIGTANISLTQQATIIYPEGSADTIITINPSIISAPINIYKLCIPYETFKLDVNSTSPATISYISSDNNVATIDQIGLVTIIGVGTTILTTSQQSYMNYTSATALTNLLISNPINITNEPELASFLDSNNLVGNITNQFNIRDNITNIDNPIKTLINNTGNIISINKIF